MEGGIPLLCFDSLGKRLAGNEKNTDEEGEKDNVIQVNCPSLEAATQGQGPSQI